MKYRLLLIGALVVLLSGCSREEHTSLMQADSIMEEFPDSALLLLQSINPSNLSKQDRPYFALLFTQALVKTDFPLISDSLISIAYTSYSNDKNGDKGIRSNFYTGEVLFNQGKYRDSMRYVLTAYEDSRRMHNVYWQAKSAERISDLFFFTHNYDEAAKYSEEAVKKFKEVNRQINHIYCLGQLGRIYVNNGNAEKAYVLLDSLKDLCLSHHPIDSAFLKYIQLPLVDAMLQTGRIKEAQMDRTDFLSNEMSQMEILDATLLKSQVYNVMDNQIGAKDILKNADTLVHSYEDKVHLLYARYENAKAIGDNSLALSLVDSMLYYQNKVAEDIIQGAIIETQRDFYLEKAARNERESLHFKKLLGLCICIFILLFSLLTAIFFFRSRVQQIKLDANIQSILSLKAESNTLLLEKNALLLEKNQMDINHSRLVEKLFKEKWTTLDTLCDQYFGLKNSELNTQDLISNIEKELKKIVSKKGLSDIVEAVDTYMGGIVTKLRNQCSFLKDSDIEFLALLYAGFSARAVCMFFGISYRNFYTKKCRLRKNILSSDACEKNLFLEKLKSTVSDFSSV